VRLKNFNREGKFRIPTYTFCRVRLPSPTECYRIWLEDSDGYILVEQKTLITDVLEQLSNLRHRAECIIAKPFMIVSSGGYLLC
jgi:hypothetical protein